MQISEVICSQVGLGREFTKKDGTKVRDMVARCIPQGAEGELGSSNFIDYKFNPDELKDTKKYVGKILTISVNDIRQPYAGAPFTIAGKIVKAV